MLVIKYSLLSLNNLIVTPNDASILGVGCDYEDGMGEVPYVKLGFTRGNEVFLGSGSRHWGAPDPSVLVSSMSSFSGRRLLRIILISTQDDASAFGDHIYADYDNVREHMLGLGSLQHKGTEYDVYAVVPVNVADAADDAVISHTSVARSGAINETNLIRRI